MAKTEENLRSTEEFIKRVLQENFNQTLDPDRLRAAAEKLCDALPSSVKAGTFQVAKSAT